MTRPDLAAELRAWAVYVFDPESRTGRTLGQVQARSSPTALLAAMDRWPNEPRTQLVARRLGDPHPFTLKDAT